MVAMRRRPVATRCRTARRAPSTLSTSTYGRPTVPCGRPLCTTGTRESSRVRGSWSPSCKGHQDHAVDVAAGQVAGQPVPFPVRADHHQDQLFVGVGEHLADRADHGADQRVGEHLHVRLAHHQRHRVGAPGDQGAGGAVRDVPELRHGVLDQRAGLVGDPRRAVDHPGRRRPGHAGRRRHGLQGRRGPGGWCRRSLSLVGPPLARLSLQPWTALAAITPAYQRPLAFTVRRWVAKSTYTIPKRLE